MSKHKCLCRNIIESNDRYSFANKVLHFPPKTITGRGNMAFSNNTGLFLKQRKVVCLMEIGIILID